MMVAAARKQLSLVGVNLWQTGIRSLFCFYMYRGELSVDEAWSNVRIEMTPAVSRWEVEAEEWEWQLIRAIIVEEHNVTIEEAKHLYDRSDNSTPIIDAIRVCISKTELSVDK
tara:strand:+ start:367 stop:705 length:339 start_codon:yes stop_codon:yes gene_type:complete